MDNSLKGKVGKLLNGRWHKQTNYQVDRWTNRQTIEQICRQTDNLLKRQAAYRETIEKTSVQTDRLLNRHIDKPTNLPYLT